MAGTLSLLTGNFRHFGHQNRPCRIKFFVLPWRKGHEINRFLIIEMASLLFVRTGH
jgi:hypothetical protein